MKQNGRRLLAAALALMLALALCVPALADTPAPDDGLATRGDVVKALYFEFVKGLTGVRAETLFADVPADSDLFQAVCWASGIGVVKGYGNGLFGPDDLVTREQAAAMLYRYAQTEGKGFQGAWMFLLDYPDAAEVSDWANEAIHWVVMNGIITEKESGRLEPKDYIGVNELPVWIAGLTAALGGGEEPAPEAEDLVLTNSGLTLTVPAEYADRLITETPEDAEDGTLFSVWEKASVEAARAKGYEDAGMGWLFSIRRVGEDELNALLCGDMSGQTVIAADEKGDRYLFCTPTDVRYDRETTEQMIADQDQWAELSEWASVVAFCFAPENNLIPEHRGNTIVDIYLNRTAYDPDAKYTLSTLEFGPLEPAEGVDAEAFVLRALRGAEFNYAGDEAPDGEYLVLNFPEEEVRFDFFRGQNLVRRVSGEYAEVYEAAYDDGETVIGDVMYEWYAALAAAHGMA